MVLRAWLQLPTAFAFATALFATVAAAATGATASSATADASAEVLFVTEAIAVQVGYKSYSANIIVTLHYSSIALYQVYYSLIYISSSCIAVSLIIGNRIHPVQGEKHAPIPARADGSCACPGHPSRSFCPLDSAPGT
jgi:hypothetical protein